MNTTDHKKVMVIGAHPDDSEFIAGGLAKKLVQTGVSVQFLAVTNGNVGHHLIPPDQLAIIREKEAQASAKVLGVKYSSLGVNDGEVLPNLEQERKLIHAIRRFSPDMIITHRVYDYHRDHRYTGQLVMDASTMLRQVFYYPEVPAMTREMPIIAYGYDAFTHPYPLEPHIILDVSDVYDQKITALMQHTSQMFEAMPWGMHMENGIPGPEDQAGRKQVVKGFIEGYYVDMRKRYRDQLQKYFPGKRYFPCEIFEISEYGRKPSKKELSQLFPDGIITI